MGPPYDRGHNRLSQATYFNWKKRYGGLPPEEMRRLKSLQDENARLKKIAAGLTLDCERLQDVIRRKLWVLRHAADRPIAFPQGRVCRAIATGILRSGGFTA